MGRHRPRCAWSPTRARSRKPAEPGCCRWSKLTATGWAPPAVGTGVGGAGSLGIRRRHGRTKALALREAGIRRPILVVTPLSPDTFDPLVAARLPARDRRRRAAAVPGSRGPPAPFHVEIDTGMGRAGIRWDDGDAIHALAEALGEAPGWEGVFTHFHSADSDSGSVATQWSRFQTVLGALPRRPPLVHAANSAAALCGRAYAADLVRPGIFLYGGQAGAHAPAPRPVASLRARVLAVRRVPAGETVSYGAAWKADRPTVVATLGVGYADGLPRAADRAGGPPRLVELRGRSVPIIGRVTMDMCMVAVEEGEVAVGDVATLFGGAVSLDESGPGRRHDLLRAADLARPPAAPALPMTRRAAIIVLDGLGIGPARDTDALRRHRQQHAGQRGAPGRRPLAAAARGPRSGPLRCDRRRPRRPLAVGGVRKLRAGERGEGQHHRALGDLRARAGTRRFPPIPTGSRSR